MKADESCNPKRTPPRATSGSATAQRKPCADQHTPAADTEDCVHLSPRAEALAQARRLLDAIPDVDTEKVREIQRRLQSGRYRLNADKIAESMLQDALNHKE